MRILVAEDEIDLAEALKMMLEMQKYSVELVHDGADALFYAESTPYDLILLDVMMPKKSGVEVVRELRAGGNTTPVLMLTAKSQLEDKVTGLEEGAEINVVWVNISSLRKKLASIEANVTIKSARGLGYQLMVEA